MTTSSEGARADRFNANNLFPGYVKQGFSYLRREIYASAEEKGKIAGMGACVLCNALEWLEVPFRVVEHVALAVINLLGSIFNEGCRQNLSAYIGWPILIDLKDTALAAIVYISTIAKIVAVGIGLYNAYSDSDDLQSLRAKENDTYHRISAIRKHGYDKIHAIEEGLASQNRQPDYEGLFYTSEADVAQLASACRATM